MKHFNLILLILIIITTNCFSSNIQHIYSTSTQLNESNSSAPLRSDQNNENRSNFDKFILILILLILILALLFVYLMSVKSDKEVQLDNRIKELRSYINVIRKPDNTLNEGTIKEDLY